MMPFNAFLASQGVNNSNELTGFVSEFLEDPSIFFELSTKDRASLEKKIDQALLVCKNNISFQ